MEHFSGHYTKMFPCHRLDFLANVKIPKTMFCSDCRRNMQQYHSFICCHEDNIPEESVPPTMLPYEA